MLPVSQEYEICAVFYCFNLKVRPFKGFMLDLRKIAMLTMSELTPPPGFEHILVIKVNTIGPRRLRISVLHCFVEQLSYGKLYESLKDFVLSQTFLKISCKNSIYRNSQKHKSTLLHTYVLTKFLTADRSWTENIFEKTLIEVGSSHI